MQSVLLFWVFANKLIKPSLQMSYVNSLLNPITVYQGLIVVNYFYWLAAASDSRKQPTVERNSRLIGFVIWVSGFLPHPQMLLSPIYSVSSHIKCLAWCYWGERAQHYWMTSTHIHPFQLYFCTHLACAVQDSDWMDRSERCCRHIGICYPQ